MDDLRLLEEKHVMHILNFIGNNPNCMKTEIYDAISHNPRMPDKLRKLEDAGLIVPRSSESCTRYTLTETGYRINDLIIEISKVFGDDDRTHTFL